jgi:hypothetical protein
MVTHLFSYLQFNLSPKQTSSSLNYHPRHQTNVKKTHQHQNKTKSEILQQFHTSGRRKRMQSAKEKCKNYATICSAMSSAHIVIIKHTKELSGEFHEGCSFAFEWLLCAFCVFCDFFYAVKQMCVFALFGKSARERKKDGEVQFFKCVC